MISNNWKGIKIFLHLFPTRVIYRKFLLSYKDEIDLMENFAREGFSLQLTPLNTVHSTLSIARSNKEMDRTM